MRLAIPSAIVTLLSAWLPAVASAAAPTAASSGSDLIPALVIAGGGALVIMLIMVLVPGSRRGASSSASGSGSPNVTAFRAHPISPTTGAEPTVSAAGATAVTEPEPPEAPVPATEVLTPAPLAEPTPEAAPDAAAPEAESTPEAERVTEADPLPQPAIPVPTVPSRRTVPAPTPSPVPAAFALAAAADLPAAEEERSTIAVANPPHREAAPGIDPTGHPAPDLLSALSPAAVLGESFDPQTLRSAMAQGPMEAGLEPELDARALLRDHSLAVPLAACLVLGLTVHLVRSRRRR